MGNTRTHRGHVVLSQSDLAVLAAGAAATTSPWWGPLFDWLPYMAQGIIVAATVVFVIVRAINEVMKFIRDSRKSDLE